MRDVRRGPVWAGMAAAVVATLTVGSAASASVADRLGVDGAVVVLVPGASAATCVVEDVDDEALVVVVAVAVTAHDPAARGRFGIEGASRSNHASPIHVEGIERVLQRPTAPTPAEGPTLPAILELWLPFCPFAPLSCQP